MDGISTSGKYIISMIGVCSECDYEFGNRRDAMKHCKETGHMTSIETVYTETFDNDEEQDGE